MRFKLISFKNSFYEIIAKEVSTVTRYMKMCTYVTYDNGQKLLYDKVECESKQHFCNSEISKHVEFLENETILLNGNFNYDADIQTTLLSLHSKMARSSRIIVVLYNPFWSWLFKLAGKVGYINGGPPETFLTRADLENLCYLTNFEVVRYRPTCFIPMTMFGIGTWLNKLLCGFPAIRNFALTSIITIRPIKPVNPDTIFLSIIIPARNEAGNIENAILRLPKLPVKYEVVFIEGNSTDSTWTEIQRVAEKYGSETKIITGQQRGKGKGDAVERGIELSNGNLLTILDADLTMPPEKLPLFLDAYLNSKGDLINGSRLLYPMKGQAMRFLNKIGNYFFATALSFVLESTLTDSLCGTKLFSKTDYLRFMKWRERFGKFDPFGDFDLLFPAAILGLGIINIPIQYMDRTYGETNISRFRHGLMLLKMTMVGFFKVRLRIF